MKDPSGTTDRNDSRSHVNSAGSELRLWAGAHLIKKAHGACVWLSFMFRHLRLGSKAEAKRRRDFTR